MKILLEITILGTAFSTAIFVTACRPSSAHGPDESSDSAGAATPTPAPSASSSTPAALQAKQVDAPSASADVPRAPIVGPVGSVGVGGPSITGGSIPNAVEVVAGMAAGFRRCYKRGLEEDPDMKGTIRVTATIGPKGEVTSSKPSQGGTVSATVMACVATVVAGRSFSPPQGSPTIVIPVSFAPHDPP